MDGPAAGRVEPDAFDRDPLLRDRAAGHHLGGVRGAALFAVDPVAAGSEGTPAFNEFPGGAKRLAETSLKPGATFYEVEITEPGKDSGMKYHLFFWDGARWRMLGLVRMDGNNFELFGNQGRLRTKVCWSVRPYTTSTVRKR